MQSRVPTLAREETTDPADSDEASTSEESVSADDSSDDEKSLDEIIDAYAE
jgi:hypothetical protein